MAVVTTKASTRLKQLIHRKDKVLVVLHPPSAAHARVMEEAGCEAGFVGTGGVVGAYTGMDDVGQASMMECIQIARWIAESVKFPIIIFDYFRNGFIVKSVRGQSTYYSLIFFYR